MGCGVEEEAGGGGGGGGKHLANRHILPFYGPLPESVKFLNSEYKAINGAFI